MGSRVFAADKETAFGTGYSGQFDLHLWKERK